LRRLLATIEERAVVEKILTQGEVIERILVHLGLPSEPIVPESARILD